MADLRNIRSVHTAGFAYCGRRFTREAVTLDLDTLDPHIRVLFLQELESGSNLEDVGKRETSPAIAAPPVAGESSPDASAAGGADRTPYLSKSERKRRRAQRDGG